MFYVGQDSVAIFQFPFSALRSLPSLDLVQFSWLEFWVMGYTFFLQKRDTTAIKFRSVNIDIQFLWVSVTGYDVFGVVVVSVATFFLDIFFCRDLYVSWSSFLPLSLSLL